MTALFVSLLKSVGHWTISAVDMVVKSFQTKILLLVLASVLIPSAIMYGLTMQSTERFQTEHIEDRFNYELNNARKEIKIWYKDRVVELDRLLQSSGFLTPLDRFLARSAPSARDHEREEIEKYFAIVRDKFPIYREFVVLYGSDSVVTSTRPLNEVDTDLLRGLRAEAHEHAYVSKPVMSDQGSVYQWVLLPVESGGHQRATVCVRMVLDELTTLLNADDLSSEGDLYVVDANERYLTQPRNAPLDGATGKPLNLIGQPATDIPRHRTYDGVPSLERYTKQLYARDSGRTKRTRFVGSKIYLPERNWWLVCEDQERKVVAPVVSNKYQILVLDAVVCVLCLFGSWVLSRYLLRSIAALSDGARKINDGLVGVNIPGGQGDEIGQMIQAFNEMAQRISLTEAELSNNNKELERKNDELRDVNDKLERLSVTDGLTGLYNHRHFWNLMNDELARANRYQGELGLILLDIDNFKNINDQFGHATGDLLIQNIAKAIVAGVRETDLVARYGGEEFAILLPDTSRKGVLGVSEKVRTAVERMVFRVPDTDITLSVTVSVGVSVFRGSRKQFFNAADRALYLSKSEGKNRVNFAIS